MRVWLRKQFCLVIVNIPPVTREPPRNAFGSISNHWYKKYIKPNGIILLWGRSLLHNLPPVKVTELSPDLHPKPLTMGVWNPWGGATWWGASPWHNMAIFVGPVEEGRPFGEGQRRPGSLWPQLCGLGAASWGKTTELNP